MKFIKNQFAPWPVVLLIGIAVLAITLAARVSPSTIAADRDDHVVSQAANANEEADARHDEAGDVAVDRSVSGRQDYYDRRREYWEDRVNRRLDDEDLDDETGDDKDADSKDKKDSKAKDEKADKDDSAESDLDQEEELIERRREYWRDRLDREW